MLYLGSYTEELPYPDFFQAEEAFREMYPPNAPATGVRGFLMQHWSHYYRLGVS
jgi:hypothetical protein